MSDENKPVIMGVLQRHVDVSREAYERLRDHAERLGITVEELVEQALATVGVN